QKVLTSRSVRTCSSRCRQTSASGLMNAEATTSTGISTRVAKNSAISRQRLRRKEKTEAPFNGASVRIKMLSVRINSLITSPIHQLDDSRLQFASLGNVDQIMLGLAPACHQGVRLIGRVGRIFHVKVCEHALAFTGREPLQQLYGTLDVLAVLDDTSARDVHMHATCLLIRPEKRQWQVGFLRHQSAVIVSVDDTDITLAGGDRLHQLGIIREYVGSKIVDPATDDLLSL